MSSKTRRFADDGWAIWVDGDDTSTVYINDWLNPKGKSYVDLGIRIRGIRDSHCLSVYVPFPVEKDEIQDVSLMFSDKNILQATFSASCIVDYKKNEHASEIAYNGKTVDILHISTFDFKIEPLSHGTVMSVDVDECKRFTDNDEVYFIWRMPHKSLDEIFKTRVNVGSTLQRLRDLITTPVVFEKYGYSIRINESRLLPEEINRIGAFHRQKLKKATVTLSIDENYELNDGGCSRIRRLEEKLYEEYLPSDYRIQDVITYQWDQTREYSLQGHFNFFYNITRNSVSRASMLLYMLLLLAIGVVGDFLSEGIMALIGLIF